MNKKAVRRKSISVSQQELIKTELFQPEQLLPLVIQPAVEGINLTTWATTNEWIDTHYWKHGGLLFETSM